MSRHQCFRDAFGEDLANRSIRQDQSLKRCFGVSKNVSHCDWEYLQNVTMLDEPHERVPKLTDLLEFLAQPENEQLWAFLDVKVSKPSFANCYCCELYINREKLLNDPVAIVPQIAKTIASVPHAANKPWHTRLVVGCWASSFIPLIMEHLPEYRIALVCFDLRAARRFFTIPNLVAYNVNQQVLMGPWERDFLDEARAAGKKVFVWTVNSERAMQWCIRKNVDGVVTDHPDLCRQLIGKEGPATTPGSDMKITFSEKVTIFKISLLVAMFGWIFSLKFLPRVKSVKTAEAK